MNIQKKKVLMIDDDHVIRKLYTDFFAAKPGYEMTTAMDPVDGLKKANEWQPDLIVLDLILPKNLSVTVEEEEKNKHYGFDALQKLKTDEKTKSIPVIIFSNLVGDEDRQKAMALGAAEFVSKTTSLPAELLQRIAAVLSQPKK
jgi:CheY-like chemotaxis protein